VPLLHALKKYLNIGKLFDKMGLLVFHVFIVWRLITTNGKKQTLQPLRLQGFVDKVIISWRTEEHDVLPSDRTTSSRKPENPCVSRVFGIALII